jgi:hypothetical protein
VKIDFLGGKADPLILKGMQIPLFLAPKWRITCGGRIQVLGTQLLDLVVEQSAQISYRIKWCSLQQRVSKLTSKSFIIFASIVNVIDSFS